MYLQLAKKYHPDMNKNDPNAQKNFQEVSEAYEVCLKSDYWPEISWKCEESENWFGTVGTARKESYKVGNYQIGK